MSGPPSMLRPRVLLAIGAASLLFQCAVALFASTEFLQTRPVVDDAFYYWMIARNVWEHGFFTFDGIHATNGFQPLWQYLLLPLGALPREAQMRLSLVLGALAYQAAPFLLAYRGGVSQRTTGRALAAVLLWTNPRLLFDYGLSGMEFGLYMAAAVWCVLELERTLDSEAPRPAIPLLIATSLVPLARVDGLAVWGACWAAMFLRSKDGGARGRSVAMGAAALLPFVLNAVIHQFAFGSALPISGTVKRLDRLADLASRGVELGSGAWFLESARAGVMVVVGTAARFFGGFLPPGPWPRVALVTVGGVAVAGCAVAGVRHGRRALPGRAELALAAFVVLQVATYSVTIPGGLQYAQWYWGPFYALLAMLAGGALGGIARPVAFTGVGGLVLGALALGIVPQPVATPIQGVGDAIAVLEEQTSGAAEPVRVGSWNAGIVAWRAPEGWNVINLDGLVNDASFARRFAGDRNRRSYLREEGIHWLVDYALGEEEDSWERVVRIRLGENGSETDNGIPTAVFIGGPCPAPGGPPRRYHVLRGE